jgi:prevent-host-death family protein
MDQTINVHDAKTHFSRLLDRVMAGEEIIIAKAGVPVARLVPINSPPAQRRPGTAKGKMIVQPGFEEPLPEDVLKDFGL